MATESTAEPSAQPLLIFPYNGNGLEALDCLGDAWRLVAFVDDTPEKQGHDRHGCLVTGRDALQRFPDARVLAVPGGPASYRARRQVVQALDVPPQRLATVIHPSARVSPLATIGRNVLIMAGVVITSNAVIGDHVVVLPNTVIHHDARIGDWCLIGSNVTIAGSVTLGENCYVGSGTSIMNGLDVGAGSLLGLGSNVIRSVAAGTCVAGNPARSLHA
ncbi:NeuD/PglB/VioB family sugar acetyltransferase [Azohydromonas lata]|uniref:NeuD/PglB/VioB family sugar acetyltransferase n=1 Tax=Azohydromonas lata TaxID=45677 RepID=A0ABU5IA79_9BURK|nr:NeuD/PglB/VioB family sugar acetyltransferase [Azohydromonas lata]MDZ5456011.1 NeuD/PglB/VioB family sugar acetyltransferase [Azohydromonas lata]